MNSGRGPAVTRDLGNGEFGNRQEIRLSGSVLSLHRHSLQDGADKASKPARIRVLLQFTFFDATAKPRLERRECLAAKSGHVAGDRVIFDSACQNGGRDHAAFRPTGKRKLMG